MKKVLVTLLALIFILGTVATGFAAPASFSDVDDEDVKDAVTRLNALGILDGYPDGTFKPENTITRAEFAKIIVTALGVGNAAEYARGVTKFSDVPATHWASGYINVASDMGIIKGYGNGKFGPQDKVTYAQAITMIVRALGYEPKAQALGGYPGGYLAIAAEKDITDGVSVVNTLAANRGDIALMVDNALEVPMMVQKTWGQYPEYEEDENKTLLSELDVEEISGRVTDIPRTNSKLDDDEIKIGNDTYTVVADVDFETVFGQEVTAFVNDDDEVISVEIDSEYYLDALKDVDADELTLVEEDETYDIADDAVVYIDGEEKTADDLASAYAYAKVVLNDDEEVVFVDAFTLDDYMVVEEVDGDIVFSYGDELDLEDYTIVKDGKTIAIENIAVGDILFYDNSAEYAEVYVESYTGEIEEIYANDFKVDDEDFAIDGKYLDDDELVTLDTDALESMQDEGEVTVYVDREGDVVFVDGELGEAETSTVAGFLYRAITVYQDVRNNDWFYAIDMVNEKGEEVTYDVKAVDVDVDVIMDFATDDSDGFDVGSITGVDAEETDWDAYTDSEQDAIIEFYITDDTNGGNWDATDAEVVAKDTVIEVTFDEDGDITELAFDLDVTADYATATKTDAKYIASKKLKSNVVVFDVEDYISSEDEDDIIVTTWADVGFDETTKTDVYYGSDGYVDYLVVEASDRDDEDLEEYVALITDVKELSSGDEWRIKAYVDGVEKTFYTDDTITDVTVVEGEVAVLTYDLESELLTKSEAGDTTIDAAASEGSATVTGVAVRDDEITTDAPETYTIVEEGYVFDITDTSDITEISLRDIEAGDKVDIVLDETGTTFAKYVLLTYDASADEGTTTTEAVYSLSNLAYDSTNFDVTVEVDVDNDNGDYALRLKAEDGTVVGYEGVTVANNDPQTVTFDFTAALDDGVYTVELVKVSDPNTVLDSIQALFLNP